MPLETRDPHLASFTHHQDKDTLTLFATQIAFLTVVFCLPTVNPVTQQSFNYTSVAVCIVGVFAFGSWFAWARFWFTGRCRNHCAICIRQLDFLAGGEGTEMGDQGEGGRRVGYEARGHEEIA